MRKYLIFSTLLAAVALTAAEYQIKLTPSVKDGIAKSGEEFTFTAQALSDGKAAPADMTLKVEEYISGVGSKTITMSADKTYTFKKTPTEPGFIYVRCWLLDNSPKKKPVLLKNSVSGKIKNIVGTGVFVDPEKQRIVRAEPADFDEVWNKYKSELKAVPLKELERKPLENAKASAIKTDVYDVKVAAPGGKNVSGILTVPQDKTRKYPAIVFYHGAGVRSAGATLRENAITFDINAHGLPNMMPKKFYNDIRKKKSPYAGTPDQKAEMFRYMFLRALRALEYVKSLPEWNGRDLIVTGGSQGGVQTIVAAAQDQSVTLAVPSIPAMIGVAEYLTRKNVYPAWPNPYTKQFRAKQDVTAFAKKFDYLDGAFHLRRIKCPIYVAVGMFDTHAAHVVAAMNDCPSEKKVFSRNIFYGHHQRNIAGVRAINAIIAQRTREAKKSAK